MLPWSAKGAKSLAALHGQQRRLQGGTRTCKQKGRTGKMLERFFKLLPWQLRKRTIPAPQPSPRQLGT